ncbi:hypothetical protein ACK36E_15025 [Aeromonas veronii]
MGSQNQIKLKLLELEGGTFQRLCDDWLHRKGFENINPIGMMQVTDRVVKGTPDSLHMQDDGSFIFSEYTVQQERLVQKLEDDINKCFDETKTGITIENIAGIIICYLGKLTTEEINKLRNLCYNKGVMLTLYGLDSISLSIKNSYPVLSETYLDLPLDTGQLLSVNDFITRYGKSNFTTSIDHKLLFREEFIENATQVLERCNFLLISGAAGLGKTLLSVNLANRLKHEKPELKVICLFDKGADLIRDITAYFSEPGEYLIFVDDANRLDNRLDYILHYLNDHSEKRNFKIIATVRDYARSSVIDKVKKYTTPNELIITPLTDEQIKTLSETLFGIKNRDYQERIQEVSCGNPRLAIMASKVAIETNQIESIQNVTSLYKDYFGENENVKIVMDDKRLALTACAICFFQKIDKLNEKQMKLIESSFGIQSEDFWELVDVLHKNELVDLYENEVVKITDQVLSTYLFYTTVFERKIFSFSSIVNDFYPNYKSIIVDSLNPVIRAFDQKAILADIRSEIQDIFSSFSTKNNTDASIEFLNTFWFALPTETLLFAESIIEEMPEVEINWGDVDFVESKKSTQNPSLVDLLSNFRFYGELELKLSFELLAKYIAKNQSSIGVVIRALLETYNIKHGDWRNGYFVQANIIDTLIILMRGKDGYLFSRLFILYSKTLLKIEHREHKWSRGNTINIITFRVSPDNYLTPIREKIIFNMGHLIEKSEMKHLVIDLFKDYVNKIQGDCKDIVALDLPFFEQYLVTKMDRNDISQCIVMQNYCDHLESLELSFPKNWRDVFSNKILDISDLLLEDRQTRRTLNMGYEEYNQYRHQSLVSHFANFSSSDFNQFLERCKILHNSLCGRDRNYLLKHGLEMSLIALAESSHEIYPELISIYLEHDDYFQIDPNAIVILLFNKISSDEVYSLLTKKVYRSKNRWLSAFFAQLPETSVSRREAELFLGHINNVQSHELHGWLDFLDKYKSSDSSIYSKVVRILVDKSKSDITYGAPLGHLFSTNSSMFGRWFTEFHPDRELVFEAYLTASNLDWYWDYSGEALNILLNERFDFIYKIIDQIYIKEKWPDSHTNMPDLHFLWERQNYIEDIENYAKYLYHKDVHAYRYGDSVFSKIFINSENSDEHIHRKKEFCRNTIKKNASDIPFACFVFNVLQHLDIDFRRELIAVFLHENNSFEDFQGLDYELTTRSWSGSRVPILDREKNFLESLLPLFNSIKFLKHKLYVEKQIENKEKSIEYEKKRDYLESR